MKRLSQLTIEDTRHLKEKGLITTTMATLHFELLGIPLTYFFDCRFSGQFPSSGWYKGKEVVSLSDYRRLVRAWFKKENSPKSFNKNARVEDSNEHFYC